MKGRTVSPPHFPAEIHVGSSNSRANQSTCDRSTAAATSGQCPSWHQTKRTFCKGLRRPRERDPLPRRDLLVSARTPNTLPWHNAGREAQGQICLFSAGEVSELHH